MLALGPSLPLAFWLWVLPSCLSASGKGWDGPQLASSVLCSMSGPGNALHWSFSRESSLSLFPLFFFFFSSLAVPGFGLLSHISSLRLPSGHSGLVLNLSNTACASLFSPHLLVADASVWASSLLGVVVRHVICGFYLFIFSSQLCCPLRFQNSPQTRW